MDYYRETFFKVIFGKKILVGKFKFSYIIYENIFFKFQSLETTVENTDHL